MRRLLLIAVATLALGIPFVGIAGARSAALSPVVLALPLALAVLAWVLFRRTDRVVELRWAGGRPSVAAPTRIAAGHAGVRVSAGGPRPTTRRQVIAALGRAEARQWLASPWFAVGVAFCVLLTVLFGWLFPGGGDGFSWREWFVLMPVMAHPMVGMTLVGAHHAVTRGRRSDSEELFGACPTDEAARTAAHLRSSWVPAAVMVPFIVTMTALLAWQAPQIYGPIDGRAVADSAAAIVLVVCGAWLGVALGRWTPWTLAPVIAVPALLPVIVGLGNIGDPHWSNVRQLSTWPRYPPHDLLFTAPRVWWHLLWLAGLGAFAGVVALAHARRHRRVLAVGAAVMAVAVLAGVVQSLPVSDRDAARLASLVARPQQHQTCRADGRAELCVYRGYKGYIDSALPHAGPVVAAAPSRAGSVTFRQGFDGDVVRLGPEVNRERKRLARTAAKDTTSLPLGYSVNDEAMVAVRLTAALHLVGLPERSTPEGVPVVIAGDARGVVALWLAARGLPADEAQSLASHHYNSDDDPADRTPTALELGMAWPDPCATASPPVAWAAQDLAAARALLARPDDDVRAVLHSDWARYTDAATTTDELLAAAGLEPVGPPDRIQTEPIRCPY